MPYFDSEIAVGHMNVKTGKCIFFYETGSQKIQVLYRNYEIVKNCKNTKF